MCARQCAVYARHHFFDVQDDDDARGVLHPETGDQMSGYLVWTSSLSTSARLSGPSLAAELSLRSSRYIIAALASIY